MKSNIERVIEDIERTGSPWVVERQGMPKVVLVDPYELADMKLLAGIRPEGEG